MKYYQLKKPIYEGYTINGYENYGEPFAFLDEAKVAKQSDKCRDLRIFEVELFERPVG